MAYPPFLGRITHFTYDLNAGLTAPSAIGTDAELDAILEVLNQQNVFIRRITTTDGQLKNVGAALAMSLAGMDTIVATAAQTDFVTDIVWNSGMSTSSVLVFANNVRVTPVSVQDDGSGFLEVTLAAQALSTSVVIYAFSGQTAVLAEDVSIADAGAYTAQVTVEDALQEIYSHTQGASGKTWLEGVLVMSNYLLKAGGSMASAADITFSGGGTVKGLPASAANGQAVRHEQFISLQGSLSGLTSTFMPKAGGTFTGAVNFGGIASTGVPTPTTTDAIAPKSYVDSTLASFGGLPVATLVDFAGSSAPTGWLLCDGAAVSRTTYASLFSVIGVTWGVGDGTTTFNVPDLRGRSSLGAGAGSGLTVRTLAATGGEETHTILEAELPAHYHHVFADAMNTASAPNKVTAALNIAWSGTGSSDEAYQSVAPSVATPATLGRTSVVGSGTPITQMHPFAVVTKIIKF